MESLISFNGVSDVANNLINKLSGAVGWIMTHDTPKKIAVDTYIKEIQDSDYDALTKAAFICQAKKTIKEYCNQHKIVDMALNMVNPSAKPDALDDDWLLQFMDKARLVSDADFQIIWSNILAEECNSPGTIPKALLHILEQMDKHTATAFMNIAAISVEYDNGGRREYCPIVIHTVYKEYYKGIGIDLDNLIELQSLGLIKFGEGHGYSMELSTPVVVHYHDQEYQQPKEFCVGEVVYTRIGNVLCSVVKVDKVEDFFEKICVPFWEAEKNSIKAKIVQA